MLYCTFSYCLKFDAFASESLEMFVRQMLQLTKKNQCIEHETNNAGKTQFDVYSTQNI